MARSIRQLFGRGPSRFVQWADLQIPVDRANRHFLATGATRSGKTTLLRMLLRSILPDLLDPSQDVRVLLYDPKAQWNTELIDLGLEHHRKLLNPFDSRSVAWDMAADITSEADAGEVASLFIPPTSGGENQFFYKASWMLLKSIFWAFIRLYRSKVDGRPWTLSRPWQLRDVLLACSNLEDLSDLLSAAQLGKRSVEEFMSAEREARSVRMTVQVENEAYNAIAAAWHRATEAISLNEWMTERNVWVLGASKKYSVALATVNRLILQRLQQVTLGAYDKNEASGTRSWFVLDEFASLGPIPKLFELLEEGGERGVCGVLGFQHISQVRDLYSTRTEALLDQCHHQAFFKANGYEQADWCSKRFPNLISYDEDSPHIKQQSPSVDHSRLLELPSASPTRGFTCIVRTEDDIYRGPKLCEITPRLGPPKLDPVQPGDTRRAPFVWRSGDELDLQPWGEDERVMLHLSKEQRPAGRLTLPRLDQFQTVEDFYEGADTT